MSRPRLRHHRTATTATLLLMLLAGAAGATLPTAAPTGRAWDRASANALLASLMTAAEHGLDMQAARGARLRERLEADPTVAEPATIGALTAALLDYASDLARGHVDPTVVDAEWHHPRPPFDPTPLLVPPPAAGDLGARLEALAPHDARYAALQGALARYRALAAAGGWPLPGDGPWLREGERHANVARVRARLAVTDQALVTEDDPDRFDAALAAALRRFQARHGLKTDAVVGPNTRAALNVPVQRRVAQLAANLERWRWLPADLGADHLLVNTAGHEVTLTRKGHVVYHARAITGRRSRSSPSFASRITRVVFNPPWTVPYRIATRDLLPKQQADPGYFASKRIHVLERGNRQVEIDVDAVDWSLVERRRFPYVLRQEPGPGNSLGRIKFQMPNAFSIYLHDTPDRDLFAAPSRAFSSGCIRVERPEELARLLFADEASWDADRIARAIGTERTRHERLPTAVTIYLAYLSAWVAADGSVQFRRDIYGLDGPLIEALRAAGPGQDQASKFDAKHFRTR